MEPRSKQACEPCRKKKSKCTGERPTCSFCRRLNQLCTYRSLSHVQRDDLQERFQMLESQVKGIYELLQPSPASAPNPGPSPSTSASIPSTGLQAEYRTSPGITSSPSIGISFNLDNPDVPSEVFDHLIEIYRTKLHLQPLQLFNISELKDTLTSAPQYLLYSFLALTVRYSAHDFFNGKQVKAVELYGSSAQQEVAILASQGIPKLEIVQALCLLVLVDVAACKPGRAWMSIGTMSRLEALRKLSQSAFYESSPELEASLRCHWTVALLEQTFMPQERSSIYDDDEHRYPPSARRPPSLPPTNDGECPPDLFSDDASEDLGVTAYYINVIEMWGHLSSYMHQVRIGKAETAWSPGSMHYILCAELYKHETKLPHSHLLRNVHFTKRMAVELQDQREYWIPWLLMQVVTHAITAILHHPFVHLVAMRDRSSRLQARSFLQQTVDQALFNSAWVFKLLRLCEELRFEICDPLVGQLVAVVATIPWLFQRAIDPKVAEKAKGDLEWCKGFLERLSSTWPHIAQKLELLQSLDSTADNNPQPPAGKGISIVFHPALFWALVDPKISQMTPLYGESSSRPQDAMIRISTHYIHPLTETQVSQPASSQREESLDPFMFDVGELEEVNLNDIFSQFMPDIYDIQ
ncbi:Zn(2)-C6 fungal-type DNA-binding domain [Fusarium oxysporum f. sp. vasinfectum]|nr:Zn(2)-C6 fungal-type DNA-binding domain [Fusarium oxysporum f. sp. vasinfectum]